MWPSGFTASSSLLLLSLAAFLLECHRLGIFTARVFPSRSNRLQLEPGDSSWLGRGYWRGPWRMPGLPSSSALTASAQFPTSLEMQTSSPHWAGPGGTWASGAVGLRGGRGGLGDQRVHLSEGRSWPWPHFLQPRLSHEGSGLGFCPQVGLCLPGPGSLTHGGTQPW